MVSATGNIMDTPTGLNDTLAIALSFSNGSVAIISYFANGSKALPKEYLEVHCAGQSWVLDDFKTLYAYGASKKKTSLGSQNKGHAKEVELFLESIREGKPAPISAEEVFQVTEVTCCLADSGEYEHR